MEELGEDVRITHVNVFMMRSFKLNMDPMGDATSFTPSHCSLEKAGALELSLWTSIAVRSIHANFVFIDWRRPLMSAQSYKTPGMIAILLPTFSLPKVLTYHLHPAKLLGSIVAISLNKNVLAGTQPQPPSNQNPPHSIHSQR